MKQIVTAVLASLLFVPAGLALAGEKCSVSLLTSDSITSITCLTWSNDSWVGNVPPRMVHVIAIAPEDATKREISATFQ